MNNKGTRLGAVADALQSKRSMANVSAVFRSTASLRSARNAPNGPPSDQLNLNPKELEEMFSRDLRVNDPQAPKNLVRFNFKTGALEDAGIEKPIAVLFDRPGRIEQKSLFKTSTSTGDDEEQIQGVEGVLRNQFNFSDRATQGYVIEYIDEGTLTEAPVPKDCTGTTNQCEIAAYYTREKGSLFQKPHSAVSVTRVMERVVNQNLDPNACCDFKYYDDHRDSMDPKSAYTLPLWELKYDVLAGFSVSSIRWNTVVNDLFAVAYSASASEKTPGRGYVCTWTLKNPVCPRNILELTDRGVSLDWSRIQPSLLAVGSADGNIFIFDVRSRGTNPLFSTIKMIDRHQSAVTVIRWQPLDSSGNLNLVSAGMDGRILHWTLVQSEMKMTEISQINAGITALDYFNEASSNFTAVTDDGRIFEILRTRTTQQPKHFSAHSPPSLAITYNKFNSSVFATCGADWSLKLWRHGQTDQPLQIFDFAPHSVTDIQWAPHSSTVFSAVTSDGVLFIYDISLNRYKEICRTDVVESNEGSLTSVCFHPKWPMILVGDEKGRIHAMKLSPNLRKNTKVSKEETERTKLSKSASSIKSSRGILPDLNQPPEEDDEGGKAVDEEENSKYEQLIRDETEKFIRVMGVSWI